MKTTENISVSYRRKIYALLLCLFLLLDAMPQQYIGWPAKENNENLLFKFRNPPKGYGNIPFYWWNGDTLKRERLSDQLDILEKSATDGFSVSYIHTNPKVDKMVNKNGYGGFGRTDAGQPAVFSSDWLELWNWFSKECAKRGMAVGLDDYTLGWLNNGYYVDEIIKSESFRNYQGRLAFESSILLRGESIDIDLPQNVLSVVAYPGAVNLTEYIVKGRLKWKAGDYDENKIYIISTKPSPELHPDYGKKIIETYFNRIESALDTDGRRGMNYFFQDELVYNLTMDSWSEDFREEFEKRKGYNILPYLPALKEDIGDITPKIRLDYADVLVQLSEERYFKPIFDWHNERGLIYGADNFGRGLEPTRYVDYFRMLSWFTAPGNDAPARGSSFIQTKVSSSVSHLYERPRTWLEAFHSMGWDSTGEWLTEQLDHHVVAGGNLLCLHGLYYSTHGGWWEWAPPCFHFRMPYWPHMKKWLEYAERLSYLLSQGSHVCDIALMYPTESMQAYPAATTKVCFGLAEMLSKKGLDYDFMDFQSLHKSEIENSSLAVSDERYRIIILADMQAMHQESLEKILDFYKQGGIVLATGLLPVAGSRIGKNDTEVDSMIKEIFGIGEAGKSGQEVKINRNTKGGIGCFGTADELCRLIPTFITPDFSPGEEGGRVLHRRINSHDIYFINGLQKGSEIFLRAKGKCELWNAENGEVRQLPVIRQTDSGTVLKFSGEQNESWLVVFSPGEPLFEAASHEADFVHEEIVIGGEWTSELVPTLNNKWGDFRLPATDEYIGAEARSFSSMPNNGLRKGEKPDIKDFPKGRTMYGYGPHMEMSVLSMDVDLKQLMENGLYNGITDWSPYCFSWQYGVQDSPGSQGYHGLKGKVDNGFLILDKGGHQLFRTQLYVENDGNYRIENEGINPDYICIDGMKQDGNRVLLTKGWHSLLIVYADTPLSSYRLESMKGNFEDKRRRSSLVVYPEDVKTPAEISPYGNIVSTKWFQTPHLQYDIYGKNGDEWFYYFQTAPGTNQLELCLHGKLSEAWIDGEPIKQQDIQVSEGKTTINIAKAKKGVSDVIFRIKNETGFAGASVFSSPVKLKCAAGTIGLGDWTDAGALEYYSGGMIYKKDIQLPTEYKDVLLDLGEVDATCEIMVNGKNAGYKIRKPFVFNITDYVHSGGNRVEVLVYSTLSNHYKEIPSPYRGIPKAGLFGPVQLVISR